MIREQIKAKLIETMKAKDEQATGTLRLINAAIKDKDIEARPKGNPNGIDDSAVMSLLQSMIKQRKESIEMYRQGHRDDLAAKEQAEVDIIQSFLPQQMTEEEMKVAIRDVITQTGATSVKDMGKVMGAIAPMVKGKADLGFVNNKIKERLANLK